MPEPTFEQELKNLLKRHSKENGSDTPDFLLAEFLNGSLENYNRTVKARERWYGRMARIETAPDGKPMPLTPAELASLPKLDCQATEGGKVSLPTQPCCGK